MSGYKKKFTAKREFDGDTVVVEFSPMKRKHMLALTEYITFDDSGKPQPKGDPAKMLETMTSILSDCVTWISGLVDSDGETIAKETVLEDVYFMDLATWLFTELSSQSRIVEDDEKNSDAP